MMHLAKSWGDPAPLMNTLKAIEAPQLQSLLTKARGPWKELTNQEMTKLYRETFPTTIREGQHATPGETRKVVLGTAICIVVGISLASFLRETVGPTKPHTYNNPEWDAAKREHLLQQKSNPITGISSKRCAYHLRNGATASQGN
ncbi:hypothetical protein EMCRGX_G030917 [Ephydatia muelleri]